jgi:hypothetical protein
MTLEEKTKEYMLEGEFDRDKFVKTGKVYQDIGKWIQILEKDGTNPDVMKKAGKVLQNNPDFYYQSGTSPRPRLEDTFSVLQDNRAKYAKEKYSDIIDGFNEEHWMSLISNLPLYKTGNKEHDEIVDCLNQTKQMNEIAGDPEKMSDFISKKARKFDPIVQAEFRREMYNERYLKTLFGLYHKEAQIAFSKKFYGENGELNKGLAKSVFENSLHAAEAEMEKETNEGDKSDIWESDIRPQYLALDSVKYKLEKKEKEKDEDEKKDSTRKDRGKRRKEMGMSIY